MTIETGVVGVGGRVVECDGVRLGWARSGLRVGWVEWVRMWW